MSLTGPSVIFKFGEFEHLRALQEGTVYMKPWTYFSTTENNVERDSNEGTHVWFNPAQTVMELCGHKLTKESGTLWGSLKFRDERTKIFCASEACRENCSVTGPVFDGRMTKHGEHLLVITGVKQFGEQLKAELMAFQNKKMIEQFAAQRVSYFNENTYDGEVGPFRKASRFAFEKEWRLAVRTFTEEDSPFVLEIGSVKNISTLMETKDFINKVECRSDGSINLEF